MEPLASLERQHFSCAINTDFRSTKLSPPPLMDLSRSVDCYEHFMNAVEPLEEDFEVKLDEELIHNVERRESVDSKVLQRLKTCPSFGEPKRGRVTTKRKRKVLKDFSGYLLKKSGSIFRGWQKRFVYLSENRLWYYKQNSDSTPWGIINLELVNAKVKITKNDRQCFSVLVDGCKREFKFKASNQEERNAWGAEIIKHM